MRVVIACASMKREEAASLYTQEGKRVVFVAHPMQAPRQDGNVFARPDDESGQGVSWRKIVERINGGSVDKPTNMLAAWKLYKMPVYSALVESFGEESVYILSAGWGLVSASYQLPTYDITFSKAGADFKRRHKDDHYKDFQMLSEEDKSPIVFLGGKDYLTFFASLTANITAEKHVFYSSKSEPNIDGCILRYYETPRRTNWHHDCASALVNSDIEI